MTQTPPYWAPNAVATKQGWVDPNTGELLMAIEGLEVTEVKQEEQAPQATE
jgi:hypothetical protein